MKLPHGEYCLSAETSGEVKAEEHALMFANNGIFQRCASGSQKHFRVMLTAADIDVLTERYPKMSATTKKLARLLSDMAAEAEMSFCFACDKFHGENGEYIVTVTTR